MRALLTFILLACALQTIAAPTAHKARKKGAAERVKVDKPAPPSFDSDAINNPATLDRVSPDSAGNAVARAQILLDRFHFSPGQIDGHYGDNLRVAILGFQAAHNLPASGEVDATTWQKMNEDSSLAIVPYTIAPDDVKGPFVEVPKRMDDQAKLQCTCYSSAEEAVSERFHISPDLLKALNPGKNIGNAGEQILVPNVQRQSTVPAARVEVSKSQRTVSAYADDGKLLAQYPATMGSEHDPLPIGDWKIAVIQQNPWFNYNPELFWDANPKDTKARIPPGPNNPVGVVWMGLSKEHYGIHGTPNPGTIGHTESHGCIRLTNWDAEELSQMVQVGTPAILKE